MLRLLHAGNRMEGVECFVLRNHKIDSVGCIYLLEDVVRAYVVVVMYICSVPVLGLWNSSHFARVMR